MEHAVALPRDQLDVQLKVAANILGYRQMPVTIEQFISDPFYLGDVCKYLYPFWKDKLRQIYPTQIHTEYPILVFKGGIGCISGDSIIPLANGELYTIRELYEKYPQGGFYVNSWDPYINKPRAGLVSRVYYTGKKKSYKVTTTSEGSEEVSTFITTADHKFLLNDGNYLQAKDLVVGDSLRSLYLTDDSSYYPGYKCWISKDIDDHWYPLHRSYVGLDDYDGTNVHHKDENKFNNIPDNLEILTPSEHHRTHFQERNSKGVTIKDKLIKTFSIIKHCYPNFDYSESQYEEYRNNLIQKGYINFKSSHYYVIDSYELNLNEIIAGTYDYFPDQNEIQYNLDQWEFHWNRCVAMSNAHARNDITYDRILKCALDNNTAEFWDLAQLLKCSKSCIASRVGSQVKFRELIASYKHNHVVLSVEPYEVIDVYDMTVDDYHNYGIDDGQGNLIYTHNTGKSTAVRVMACYMIHRLMCLRNIHNTFKLMPGKNIKFSFFTYTNGLGETDFLQPIDDWMGSSPYFKQCWQEGKLGEIEKVADGPRGNKNIGSDVIK